MRSAMIAVGLLFHAASLGAQSSPYAAEAPRTVAALSDDEVTRLLDGAGMGYALAAELNGVPGPRHVLDLADSLQLTPSQRDQVEQVFQRMQADARRLGHEIVRRETELDSLFAEGAPRASDVEARTLELGQLEGRLRAIHLIAHLETGALLRPEQVALYAQLRGYAGSASDAHGAHGAHDAERPPH